MSKILRAIALVSLVAGPSALAAQVVVGHTPETSPYRDITASQRLTIFGGYFNVQQDEVGATPQGGASIGLRYSIPVAGPADFYARFERVSSHREAFNPTKPAETRSLGTQNLGLYVADLGFDFNLTGRRTWHGLVPLIGFGLGITSAPTTTKDDPYDFGTQFSFSLEGGIRFNPTNSYEIRFNARPTFYQNHYPAQYFATPAGSTPLLDKGAARSGFRHAIDYTAGLSLPLFR
jgi:outer membrane protein with beta-barrel domain